MILKIKENSFFVFDLDDTLYEEIDFLKSAYRNIAAELQPVIGVDIYTKMVTLYASGENVFKWILSEYGNINAKITLEFLLKLYREHKPDIKLSNETKCFLEKLKDRNIPTGLITDGRSITQRNKLKALGIGEYFNDIIISEEFGSEKPDEKNYLYYTHKYPGKRFYFIGDNTLKDFIVPIKLGWFTICLRNKGSHIHLQDAADIKSINRVINTFEEVTIE